MAEIYNANPNLKAIGVPVQFTPEQVQEYIKCKSSDGLLERGCLIDTILELNN